MSTATDYNNISSIPIAGGFKLRRDEMATSSNFLGSLGTTKSKSNVHDRLNTIAQQVTSRDGMRESWVDLDRMRDQIILASYIR